MSVGPPDTELPIRFLDADDRPRSASRSTTCYHCGGDWPAEIAACPHCEVRVVGVTEAPRTLPRTFGIGTLMVIIAAVAITFGVMRAELVIGLVLGILFALTLIRTFGGIARAQALDWPQSTREKLALGAESFAVAFLIVGGAGLAFAATVFPLGGACVALGGRLLGLSVALAAGLTASAYVASRMKKFLWPIRFH